MIEARPEILIVGCGASGMMSVPEKIRQTLKKSNIQLEALDTYRAVQRFNELVQADENVAAALHLTC